MLHAQGLIGDTNLQVPASSAVSVCTLACITTTATLVPAAGASQALTVVQVFDSALAGLKPADRDLRIVQGIRPLLRAGLAMHHSGLLPILKEVIEILFQEGLIKVRSLRMKHCIAAIAGSPRDHAQACCPS